MQRLLMAAVLVTPLMGCWASTTHVEPVGDEHVRFEMGAPQPHLRTTTLSFRPDAKGLTLIVIRQEMCSASEVRKSREKVHTKVEASGHRWVPATVLGGMALGLVLNQELNGNDDEGQREAVWLSSAVLVGGAAALVAIPAMAERERTHLGREQFRTVPARERPCGQYTLPNARVVLRTDHGTTAAMTGPGGAARFEGVSQQQIRTIFVDDVAVEPSPAR
jgi:hypothetical protein